MEEIKPKKERKFLKAMGDIALTLFRELVLGIGKKVINKVGNKRQGLVITSIILASTFAIAQFPNTGNKQRLGFQTTADGLTWRGSISDTASIQPVNNQNAWVILDTVNLKMYSFDFTSNVWNLVGGALTMPFDSITFNTAKNGTVGVGEVEYNDTQGSLIQGLKGGNVTNVIGQQLHQRVNNRTGAPLAKGDVVYLAGSQGNRITVAKGLAVSDAFSANTFGVVAESIADNQSGFIITEGLITGLNTSTLTEDSAVYLSPTVAGALTSTKPQAPQHSVYIGVCVKSSNGSGELFVKIRNGQELDELHDTRITNPVTGATLFYSGGLWRDTTAALLVSDTASMLTPYLRKADTTNMLLPYFRDADTTSLNLTSRFNTKVNLSDTLNMLVPYLRKADTTLMLSKYLRKADTSLLNLTSRFAAKLNLSDTLNMLVPYLRKADTTNMLLPYFRDADTTQLNLTSRFNTKLNIADTSAFARDNQISGTSGQVAYFNSNSSVVSDTALRWSAANKSLGINMTTVPSGANLIIKNSQEPSRATVVTTQTFAADTTNWTRGTGWTFNGTVAVATAATGNLTYTPALTITNGNAYEVTYTISGYSAGTLTAEVGNATYALPTHNATANVVVLLPTSATGGFRFTTSTFTGNLDNISVVEISKSAPILFAGQDDGSTTLYNSLRMPNSTSLIYGGGGRYTTGSNNIGNGTSSLLNITTGSNNVANGANSLLNITTGSNNVANGTNSLRFATIASNNVANGLNSLLNITTGSNNVANGLNALYTNTVGSNNLANGIYALYSNVSGNFNVANGGNALFSNLTGNENVANGLNALFTNTVGSNNVANGSYALYYNVDGINNIGNGSNALLNNTSGSNNVAEGQNSLYNNTTGTDNVAIGVNSLANTNVGQTLTGSNNIGIGRNAGDNISGSALSNVAIGNRIDFTNATASNQGVYQNVLFFTGASGTGTTIAAASKAGIKTNAPNRDLEVAGEVRITDLTTDAPTRLVGADADGDLGQVTLGSTLSLTGSSLGVTSNTFLPLTGGTLTNTQNNTLTINSIWNNFTNNTALLASATSPGYNGFNTGIKGIGTTQYEDGIGVFGEATQTDMNAFGSAIGVKGTVAGTGSGGNGSTYGGYFSNTTTVSGNNYGLYVSTASGGDYGIYQTGSGTNYFGSNTSIGGTLGVTGATTLSAPLTVNSSAVFNEGSTDSDFRVESDGNAHMVFVDASTDRVGIGTNSPTKTLDVNGELNVLSAGTFGGRLNTNWMERTYSNSTATSLTVSVNTTWLKLENNSTITLTLPNAATYPGKELHIKNAGTGAVNSLNTNIEPLNSTTIGTAILASGGGKWATLVSDGTYWVIMAGN